MGKKRKQLESAPVPLMERTVIDLNAAAATHSHSSAADDDLGLHIVERPEGFTPQPRPHLTHSDSDSDSVTSNSDDDVRARSLTINQEFASKYESEKRKQELSKKAQRGKKASEISELLKHAKAAGSDSDSDDSDSDDSEDEDEDGALLTESIDAKISETLRAIQKRDPRLYDKNAQFFAEEAGDSDSDASESISKKSGGGMSMKQALLASMIDNSDDEHDAATAKPLTHVQEQRKLKRDFLASAAMVDEDEDDSGLFKVKVRAQLEDTDASTTTDAVTVAPTDFLKSYFANQWWRAKDESTLPSYQQIKGEAPPQSIDDDEDGNEVETAEQFEAQYNFRYEEAGGGAIVTHPRQIVDSLRKVDNKRKLARERRKAAKAEERARRDEEVKKIKNEKLKAIRAQAEQIAKTAGLKPTSAIDLDLEGEWNEEQHAKLMASMFDDDYYNDANDDDEHIIQQLVDDDHREDGGSGRAPGKFPKSTLKQELDSLYELDYEDIIGGGLKTRFKYRTVTPDSYGMSVADILNREDKELNRKVSLRKITAPYAEGNEDAGTAAGGGRQQRRGGYEQQRGGYGQQRRSVPQHQRSHSHVARPSSQSSHSNQPRSASTKSATTTPASAPTAATSAAPTDPNAFLTAAQKRRLRERKRKAASSGQSEGGELSESSKRVKVDDE